MLRVDPVATGKNIRRLIFIKNISYKQIKEACMFGTTQAIYKWMRGDCMPTLDNLVILADMFGCTVDDILVVERS